MPLRVDLSHKGTGKKYVNIQFSHKGRGEKQALLLIREVNKKRI